MKSLKTHTILLLCFILVHINVIAQQKGECVEGDCINGFGKLKINSNDYYKGYFKNGLYDSIGELNKFGHKHIGLFKNGLKHGKGIFYIHTNDYLTQVGSWKNDHLDGLIKTYYAPFPGKKKHIACNYINGKKNGTKKTYNNKGNLIKETEYKYDEKYGISKKYNNDGILIYKGYYLHNKKDGLITTYNDNGKLINEKRYRLGWSIDNKDKYYQTGCIKGDCINGYSEFIVKNTETEFEYYYGNFKDAKRNGKGTHYYYLVGEREEMYNGNFKDGKYNGQGTFTNGYGFKYNGNWKNNKKDGFGTATLKGNYTYKGNWKNDLKNGKGEYLDVRTHKKQIGTWLNDEFQK